MTVKEAWAIFRSIRGLGSPLSLWQKTEYGTVSQLNLSAAADMAAAGRSARSSSVFIPVGRGAAAVRTNCPRIE